MATQLEFFVALLLGILPALGILWFSLRRFDRPHTDYVLFDDRRVFGSLAFGMIFGVVASALGLLLPRTDIASSVASVAAILLLEVLFQLVYLNRRRVRGRFDATFYGVPLGVGVASTTVVASATWTVGGPLITLEVLSSLALFSLGQGLVNATSGVLIGFGASRGRMGIPTMQALAVRYAHAAFLFPFLFGVANPWGLVSAFTALGFGAIVYYYAYDQLLPATLPDDLRRKLRRERRRGQPVRE